MEETLATEICVVGGYNDWSEGDNMKIILEVEDNHIRVEFHETHCVRVWKIDPKTSRNLAVALVQAESACLSRYAVNRKYHKEIHIDISNTG